MNSLEILNILKSDGKETERENSGIHLHKDLDFTVRTLNKHCSTFTWNRKALQAASSDVCGQYALFFALHRCRHIPMPTIANMFTDNKEWNDILVRDFIDKWYK